MLMIIRMPYRRLTLITTLTSKPREYTTWEDIIPTLEAGTDIQAMLINDNTLSSFDEEYEEFP